MGCAGAGRADRLAEPERESHSCVRGTPDFNATSGGRQFSAARCPGTRAGPGTSLWPALLGALRGTIVELGPGAGGNLRHYTPTIRLIGIEPDAAARERTRTEADRLGIGARVLPGRAEGLGLDDASVDAVVCSFVLCSVADQPAALAQVRRVLRPGGRFVFAEHVAAREGTWVRLAQNVVAALARCRPNRETADAVRAAGFTIVDLHQFTVPGPLGARIPHIAGAAELIPEGHSA